MLEKKVAIIVCPYIAILTQSFNVFLRSPVNRTQARQYWGVFVFEWRIRA